jgi:3-isopropylmalate/(R)-2-methylmalate dehydratase small subunit
VAGIVAGSYGEIFFGNCTANGMPCLVAEPADVDWLLGQVERHPTETLELDLERQEVRFMGRSLGARIPAGARQQLLTGSWDAVGVLLDAGEAIERTARALPYVSGY